MQRKRNTQAVDTGELPLLGSHLDLCGDLEVVLHRNPGIEPYFPTKSGRGAARTYVRRWVYGPTMLDYK